MGVRLYPGSSDEYYSESVFERVPRIGFDERVAAEIKRFEKHGEPSELAERYLRRHETHKIRSILAKLGYGSSATRYHAAKEITSDESNYRDSTCQ